MKKTYGYFLLLSPEDNKKLIPTMQELSTKYVNGDIFIPHISIYDPIESSFEKAAGALDKAVKDISSFKVFTDRVEYENRWSRTLYIKLKAHDSLTKISKRLEEAFNKEYNLEPHISLMYKENLSENQKQVIANSLHIPESFQVVSCGLVDPNIQGDNWHDYARWTVIYQRFL